ncbi:phospholipid phosphatase 1-like [Chrysoperla carnea]|uniref:phospholipid phosphatase 1-like n=1 Tax=Chrysoperla carnea TaxID=189513 RepID=UPI001D070CDA|nr:phospholipid phosphatase 1-like [Chrysoperla carnea]
MALPMESNSGIYTISLYDSSQDFNSRQELRPKSLISETSQDFINDTANEQQLQQQEHGGPEQTQQENNANDKQNKNKLKMKKLAYLFIDLFIVICVIMLILAMEREWFPSKRGGFFCNDPKISYKYTGDTITTPLLLSITILLPIVFFYICELVVYIPLNSSHRNSNNNKNNYLTRSNYGLKPILINKCGKQTMLRYREYMIGLALLTVVVEVGKTIFGEPRPHFLDTCQPDAAVNCTLDSNQYINDYKCTAVLKSYRVRDSYKSFPSGHAAFSAYTGLFIIWYLQNRLIFSSNSSSSSWLLKPVIQLLCFTWMFITPLSRVTDFRHHWWDALAGTILGLLFTYYTVIVLSNNFMISDNDLDELMMINNSTNNKSHNDNQFNQMLHNNHHNNKYHHHPSIKRLLSTNSTTSTIIYKNNDHHDNDSHHYQTDKELTDINTYQ